MFEQNSLSFIINTLSSKTLIWMLFFLALGMFSVMSFVLYFHWTQYRVTVHVSKIIMLVYLLVGAVLLFLMGSIAFSYLIV